MPAFADLGFLSLVPTERIAPGDALRGALDVIVRGEELGYDSAWVYTRHLQRGLSSPEALLSAASQRTSRIGLGTAVMPLEYESLLTLSEGLSTTDLLTGGRLRVGVSTHAPGFSDADNDAVFGSGWRTEDYGYGRIRRLRDLVAGTPVLTTEHAVGPNLWSGRAEPVSPGLDRRIRQGAGSLPSVRHAAAHGFDLLLSNIATTTDGETDYTAYQSRLIEEYRSVAGEGARVSVALVVVPTDGVTGDRRERYAAYAASRADRPGALGPGGMIIAPDLYGTTEEITARLLADPALARADEFLFTLPFSFDLDDYRHIVDVVAERVLPALRA